MTLKTIDKNWFSKTFNLALAEINQVISDDEIKGLVYEELSDEENLAQVRKIEELNASKAFRVSSQESNPVWEKGWGEVYERLNSSENVVEEILKPQYFGKSEFLRFEGRYIRIKSDNFEYQMDLLIRKVVFYKYFSTIDNVVELGCGTGNSLLLLNSLFPRLTLTGADWATPSQKLIKKISLAVGTPMHGVHFNMFNLAGSDSLNLDPHCALLTVHALEQLGADYKPLLSFVIERKPKLCVHLEPIDTFYDSANQFDRVAEEYHAKRNYLTGYYRQLKKLEEDKLIDVIEEKRVGFGGLFHEAYNLIVWKFKH